MHGKCRNGTDCSGNRKVLRACLNLSKIFSILLLSPKNLKFFMLFPISTAYQNKIYRHKRSILNFSDSNYRLREWIKFCPHFCYRFLTTIFTLIACSLLIRITKEATFLYHRCYLGRYKFFPSFGTLFYQL
jgi:hypothetical protein